MIDNIFFLSGLGKSDHLVPCLDFHSYPKQHDVAFTKKNYFEGNYKEILDQFMIQ